jgi:hypothetical protein
MPKNGGIRSLSSQASRAPPTKIEWPSRELKTLLSDTKSLLLLEASIEGWRFAHFDAMQHVELPYADMGGEFLCGL